jgi:hypothetical protein
MKRTILLSFLLVLLIPAWAFAKAAPCSTSGAGSGLCYVDNSCAHNGNGTCNGTAPSCTCASTGGGAGPFNSITNMQADNYTGGDQILLKAGDTFYEQLIIPSSGNSTNPITFGSYGTGNKPVISGLSNSGAALSGFTVHSGNVWKIAITAQPYGLIINTLSGANAFTPLPPTASLSTISVPGNWFWASNVLYVYSVGTPDGTVLAPMRSHVVELNGKSYITLNGLTITGGNGPAFWSGSVDGTTAPYPNYIHITNCNITQSFGEGVRLIGSSNDIFDSNTFSYLYGGGIELDNYRGGTSTHVQFSNNTMHDIYGPGFNTYGDGSIVAPFSNFSIYNNISYNNSSGLYTEFMNNSNIYNNMLYNNTNDIYTNEVYGIGIASCNNSNFYNNVIHDNGNKGIDLYGDTTTSYGPSNGNKFYNNLIYNQDCYECSGITIGGTNGGLNNNIISYNILFNNYDNIAAGGIGGPPYDNNIEVFNNTIYGALEYGLNIQSYNNPGIVLNNNVFANNATMEVFALYVTANFTASDNIYYHPAGGTIVNYDGVDHTAATILSFDPQAIISNPLFTNGSGSYSLATDFELHAGSPAIGAGVNVGLTTDYAGNAVKNPPSIGAYEFVAQHRSPERPHLVK